jgi:hypothetical protein
MSATLEDIESLRGLFEQQLVDLFCHMNRTRNYQETADALNQIGYVDCYIGKDINNLWHQMMSKLKELAGWNDRNHDKYSRLVHVMQTLTGTGGS